MRFLMKVNPKDDKNMLSSLHDKRFVWVCLWILVGCDSSSRESDVPIPTAKANPVGEASPTNASSTVSGDVKERLIGGIRFSIPVDWEEKPLSSTMVLGEYSIPGEAGVGRLTMSTAGGGTAANMDRWRGQFQPVPGNPEPSESRIKAAGKEVTLLEVHGTFSDTFGGGGPKPNWQLLGVAIPIDADHNYFVKLTGPKSTVTAHRDEFIKFVESAVFDSR